MDFALVIVFLALYYVRPQEWISGLESFRPVMITFIIAIIATLFRKPGFSPPKILKSPHDWLMLIYLLWIILATASEGGNWSDLSGILTRSGPVLWSLKNKFGFYFIVMLALYNQERIEKFLWYWLGTILLLALLAVLSEFGVDLMNSYALTHGAHFKGRLVLNNSMFNNPNELGHTIIPLIPLIYLLCIWKRSPIIKQVAFAVLFIPLYCVFLTRSKGSVVSGMGTGVMAFAFGRPKIVQISVLTFAVTAGLSIIMLLPRMSNLNNPRAEEGIQGRISVFNFGYESCRYNSLLGMGNFGKRYKKYYGKEKASHSSYNQIGAELGMVGLFLYLSLYYCCLRTLVTAKTRNTSEERIRRVLMGALISFMASSWMVDFGYHSTFFFIIGSIAAFHRVLLIPAEASDELDDGAEGEGEPTSDNVRAPKEDEQAERLEQPASALTWNRYGIKDLIACLALLAITIKVWAYFTYSWGT